MRTKTEFSRVKAAIDKIEKDFFQSLQLNDATVSIRVVGEFSSGKTRFLREIFGSLIPPEFKPVSSMEKQTLLPLELTYGEQPGLELIRRQDDSSDAEILAIFDHFPERRELEKYDHAQTRLRLFVHEPRLTLADGDGYYDDSNDPQRLRIIDQPGWNSEDEDRGWEDLGLSGEWKNLALVCVCRATRLDSRLNNENLELFLRALRDGSMELARDRLPLLFVITECAPEEREKKILLQTERIAELLQPCPEKFPLKVVAVDFARMDEDELASLRQEFWTHMLSESPSPPLRGGNAETAIGRWPPAWALRPYLEQCLEYLDNITDLVNQLRPEGKFMGGRNMRYFDGLTKNELVDKARRDWKNRLGASRAFSSLKTLTAPDLPPEHCLRPWLDCYWLPRLRQPLIALRKFFSRVEHVLGDINPSVKDLEAWLGERLDDAYVQVRTALPDSFVALCRLCKNFPPNMPAAQLLATLLAASLLEARYRETWQKLTA